MTESPKKEYPFPLNKRDDGLYLGDTKIPVSILAQILSPVLKHRRTKKRFNDRLIRHTRLEEGNSYPNHTLINLVDKINTHDPKEINVKARSLFGAQIVNRIRGMLMEHYVEPLGKSRRAINYVRPARLWKHVDMVRLERLIDNYDNIKQTCDDGLHQIVPLLILHGGTASDLRQTLGKSLWKRLLRQPVSRIKYYADFVKVFNKFHRPLFERCLSIPTTQLRTMIGHQPHFLYGEIIHCSNNPSTLGLHSKKGSAVDRLVEDKYSRQIVADTFYMAQQNDVGFNPNWSTKRFEEVHRYLTRLTNNKRFSANPVCDRDVHMVEVREGNDYYKVSFTRLTSPAEVAEEGRKQGHCVASYANRLNSDDYSVYVVECEELNIRATLGLNHTLENKAYLPETPTFCIEPQESTPVAVEVKTGRIRSFSQMYGKFNRRIDPRIHRIVKDFLIEKINEGSHLLGQEPDYFTLDNSTEILYTATLEKQEQVEIKPIVEDKNAKKAESFA